MSRLSKLTGALAVVVLAAFSAPAHAGGWSVSVGVGVPPMPAMPVVVRPPMPAVGAIWVPGAWSWTGYQWAWSQGYWQVPAPRPVVVAPPVYGGYYGGGYGWRAPVVVQRPVYGGSYGYGGYRGGYSHGHGGYSHGHGGGHGHGHGHHR